MPTFSISDGNLSLLGLYKGLSNMKLQCTINQKIKCNPNTYINPTLYTSTSLAKD